MSSQIPWVYRRRAFDRQSATTCLISCTWRSTSTDDFASPSGSASTEKSNTMLAMEPDAGMR